MPLNGLWGHRGSAAVVLLAALGPFSTAWVAPSPSEGRPSRFLYYLDGNQVARVSLPGMRTETLLTLTGEESAIGQDSILATAGRIAWFSRAGPPGTLRTWDGRYRHTIPLDRMSSGSAGVEFDHDSAGSVRGYIPIMEPTYLTGFLLSPDGRQVAWNVNLIQAISPDSGGTGHQRHLVFAAGIDGASNRLVLDESFVVHSFNADARENRVLIGWSEVDPDRIHFVRELGYQMYGGFSGLYACDLRERQALPIAPIVAQVMAFSADEVWVLDTPIDETCCAGINYTNNVVTLHHLPTGRKTMLMDEWKEFGNTPKDTDEPGEGVDYGPTYAHFSPGGERLAFTIQRLEWAGETLSVSDITFVHETRSGRRMTRIPGRVVLGWQDDRQLVLSSQRYDRNGLGSPDSLFTYDVQEGRESVLPLLNIRPIAVGP